MEGFQNPYIDRLVGISAEQSKSEKVWHEYIISHIEQVGGEKIENYEIEKTQKDVELIQFTEGCADTILKQYGRKKINIIPENNIHLLKPGGTEEYTKGRLESGASSTIQQSIIVDRGTSDVQFALILFHELMHVKSYTALQIIHKGDHEESIEKYRRGLTIQSRDGKHMYLQNLEEAVVGYFTNKFYESIVKKDQRFGEEIEKINKNEIVIEASRLKEQQFLNDLVDLLYEKHVDQFSNKNEVLQLFIDAQLNGNILKLSKLIESTLGAGIIRQIGYSELS